MVVPNVHLTPPLVRQGELQSFIELGHTISSAVSPRGNTLAVFAANTSPEPSIRQNDNCFSDILVSTWSELPSDSRRKLISDSFVTMTKFNHTLPEHQNGILDERFNEADMIWFNRIADEYLICLKMDKERLDGQVPWPEAAVAYTETLYAIFGLFQAMNLPSNGSLDGLVGEELLEWLNTNFIAPNSEEAIEIHKMNSPWNDERYWLYLIRCILRGLTRAAIAFVEGLKRHPSSLMRQQVEPLTDLLISHPRSIGYSTEIEFFTAWRRWKDRVVAFKKKLGLISDEEGGDWLPWLLEIIHILEGDRATVKRFCESYPEGWKEAICVWGVWVDINLRRQTMERALSFILDDLPLDPTLSEEKIFAAFLSGDIGEAIKRANELDIWLAAHLSDMMQPLGLLNGLEEDSDLTIRQHLMLRYAEYLLVDPSLWRIAVLYMCGCGEEGKICADEVLRRVPLDLGTSKGKAKALSQQDNMDTNEESSIDEKVLEVLEICKEHGREGVRREICQIAARSFIDLGQYHLAISHYTSAEDWAGVGRVVDLILAKSITTDSKDFVASVLEIAPTLQHPSTYGQSIIRRRLSFLVKYAEFHTQWSRGEIQEAAWDIISMFRHELVPKSWWGILLKQAGELLLQNVEVMPFDTGEVFELLRRLEEVQMHTVQGSGAEYLGALISQLRTDGEREALRELESVRLALARYFARCSVLSVGGRGHLLSQTA